MKKIYIVICLVVLMLFQYREVITVDVPLTLDKKVIVIDPGHGGLDNGASFKKANEDELNLKISFALKEIII